jgi:hypothetical protein
MKSVSFISKAISVGISVTGAGLFFLFTAADEYTMVERIGGAGWILLLSTIILIPVVTPLMKRRLGGRS